MTHDIDTREALTRTTWASIDPLDADRGEARAWVVFVHGQPVDTDEDRRRLHRDRLTTAERGWAAFDEFDAKLARLGYARSSGWELGTGNGFVAWVERRPARSVTVTDADTAPAPLAVVVPLPTSGWLDDYATHLRAAGLRPRSIRVRLDHARSIAELGSLAKLGASDLEAWVHPAGRQYAPETLRVRRSSAQRLYGWLHTSGRIPSNPAALLKAPRIPVKPPRIIPDDVIERALDGATDRDRAMLLLGREACLRLREIAELRIEAREGDRLTIDGKGGTVRHVWLTPHAAAALDAITGGRDAGWYFPGRFDGHIHPEALHKIIKRVTGGWNPHSLRHAGATAAYRGTRNLRGVQALLGHASLATTQRYLTVGEDEMRALAAATERGETTEDQR